MTRGRACLATFVAAVLLAGLLPPASSAERAGAQASVVKQRKHVARKRAALKRIRWRSRTLAFRAGPGTLFGGAQGGSGAPGPSVPGGGSQPGGSPTTPTPIFHAVSVAAREYSLTLSRPLLTPGLQTVQLNNRGRIPHDLVISPEDSHDPIVNFPETASEAGHTEQVQLSAGKYRLWCSLPGHEALGMKARLRVE